MKVAVIGLRTMGMGAALNLLRKGHFVTGCDIRDAARKELIAAGGAAVGTAADLPADTEGVVVFVVNAAQTEDVLFGPQGCLGVLAKGAVILIAIFMALQQVGVAEEIVTAAFTLILGAVALAVGLAFGLGNRDLAGEITRRWYEEGQRRDRRRTDRQGPNTPPPGEPPMLD